jgi:hypothetical protein
MLRALLAKRLENIKYTKTLVERLKSDPVFRYTCGFPLVSKVPSEATFSRFIKSLADNICSLEDILEDLVIKAKKLGIIGGEHIAIDTSKLDSYDASVPKSRVIQDREHPDWGSKRDTHGNQVRWFVWKLHAAVDTKSELPVSVNVTPASVNDGIMAVPLVEDIQKRYSKYYIMDMGYDIEHIYRTIHDQYNAQAIIPMNRRSAYAPPAGLDWDCTPLCSMGYRMAYWGCGFGVGHAYNPGCVGDNVIVLKGEGRVSGTEPVSLLNNMTTNSQFGPVDGGLTNGHRIISTRTGSYMVYLTKEKLVASKSGEYTNCMNEFTLQKLNEETGSSREIGYGYVWKGDVDAVADAEGNIYVTGGYTYEDARGQFGGLNTGLSVETNKIILACFVYDTNAGLLVSHIGYREVPEGTTGFEYLTSTIDIENGKIYAIFSLTAEDGIKLACYTFDTEIKSWDKDITSYAVSAVPDEIYAYYSDRLYIVYEAENSIYNVTTDGEEKIAEGRLEDVYVKSDGAVHVLYAEEGADTYTYLVLSPENTLVENSGIPSSCQLVMTEMYNVIFALAVENEKPVTAAVYIEFENKFEFAYEILLDEVVLPYGQLMAARRDNGSLERKDMLVMLSGKLGPVKAWYYAIVPNEIIKD